MSPTEPKVSVIIPSLDRQEMLCYLLRYLKKQTYGNFEIIVVEQSDSWGTPLREMVLSEPGIRFIHERGGGITHARNTGIRNSTGEIILFLDDDIVPDDRLIEAHAECYRDPSIDGVGGRVIGGYDHPQEGVVGEFRPWTCKVIRNFNSTRRSRVKHMAGGNMSFRRSVADAVGWFDGSYGGASAIGEETDYCLRAQRRGVRFVYEPKAVLTHLHLPRGGCREETFSDWVHWHAHNAALFAVRYMSRMTLPFYLLLRIARLSFFVIEHGDLSLMLDAYCGTLNGISTAIRTRSVIDPFGR